MNFVINKYSSTEYKRWNSFVEQSSNGTFLFNRNYMEYHSDRFIDHSLTIYDKQDLVAIIPANIVKSKFISYGGLTYGGVIHDQRIGTEKMLYIFEALINYLKKNNISEIIYKAVPHIYHIKPCEEDLYALFRFNFELYRRDPSSTINLNNTFVPGKKINRYKKLQKDGLQVIKSNDSNNIIETFKNNLIKKYGLSPTHTANELNLLYNKFPNNINFYEVHFNNTFVGGAILFITKKVVHVQYMTATEEGYKLRVFDYLFTYLTDLYRNKFDYLDFGISSEQDGRYLNTGLIAQKEGFNASTICYDFYRLNI